MLKHCIKFNFIYKKPFTVRGGGRDKSIAATGDHFFINFLMHFASIKQGIYANKCTFKNIVVKKECIKGHL